MNMFLFLAQYNSLMLSFCWPALAYQIGYTCLPFHILHSQTQSDLLPLPCSNPWHQPLLDCLFFCGHSQGLPGGSLVKNLPPMQEMQETKFWSLGWEDPLEKEMATHSSILAWEIPRTEETGGLQSMGSPRIGHDWACTCDVDTVTLPQLRASVHAFSFARISPAYLWNPTQFVCMCETAIYLCSWVLSQKCRQAQQTWLISTPPWQALGWEDLNGWGDWLSERHVQGCLHSLEIAPLKISLTFDAWARLIEKCHSTWLSTEAPKQICPMWPWLPTAW